ncbi:hypothetical protein FB451DRAFT_1521653 [Mycena latifolia]|nr:hypothetical protein FB451DRAFT_1498536 [Mycena latifolia]KAJ7488885.1 hypothetical protein FB451DRAFT_1521653 [Mycena latifolia]
MSCLAAPDPLAIFDNSFRIAAAISLMDPVFRKPSFDRRLGRKLWNKLVEDAIWFDSTPVQSASVRAAIASVSREWRSRVYSTQIFWSTISICKMLPMDRLDFVLRHCQTAHLNIRLSFREDHLFRSRDAASREIVELVDSVFALVALTSHRWRTFEVVTENPLVFVRIQQHCESLRAQALESVRLSYLYMPGYSVYSSDDPVYELLLTPLVWFRNHLPQLAHLESFCAPLFWSPPAFAFRLVELYVADYACPLPMDPYAMQAIFAPAVSLRALRIGAMKAYDWPVNIFLGSNSLRALDLQFSDSPFAGSLLSAIVAPNVTELTVRDVGSRGHSILPSVAILSLGNPAVRPNCLSMMKYQTGKPMTRMK